MKETSIFSYIISFSVCFVFSDWCAAVGSIGDAFSSAIEHHLFVFSLLSFPVACEFFFFILCPGPNVRFTYSILWILFWRVIQPMEKNWWIFTGEIMVVKFGKRERKCIQASTGKIWKIKTAEWTLFSLYWIFRTNIFFCSLLFSAFDSQFREKKGWFLPFQCFIVFTSVLFFRFWIHFFSLRPLQSKTAACCFYVCLI